MNCWNAGRSFAVTVSMIRVRAGRSLMPASSRMSWRRSRNTDSLTSMEPASAAFVPWNAWSAFTTSPKASFDFLAVFGMMIPSFPRLVALPCVARPTAKVTLSRSRPVDFAASRISGSSFRI